jgi:hypothetical protein
MEAKFFDSLYEGDSPHGIKLGMGLTGGDFWPRIAGCQVLYRGHGIDRIDFSNTRLIFMLFVGPIIADIRNIP